jgi:cytochrome b
VEHALEEQLEKRVHRPRNDLLFDVWSIVHVVTGIAMAWVMDPFIALLIMVIWEPLEILVLSPLLARIDITFGHETLRNSLSDIFFDCVGVAVGYWVLTPLLEPPFHWF